MWSCFTWKYEEKDFCYKCGLVLHGNMKRKVSATNVVLFDIEI